MFLKKSLSIFITASLVFSLGSQAAMLNSESDTAELLKQNSELLSSPSALPGYVGNKVSQYTSQQVESWLKQYGNARINLNTQSQNSKVLAGSSADVLLRLHNQENRLDFIQFDTHYNDDNDLIINAGLGQRFYFDQNLMLGYNAFYDRNTDSGVDRYGIGIEAWRDYFKFSANGYFALSDWQQSATKDDYDEKAANGYDMQVEGFIPALPQLGGHLKYEQYFGDNVALFDSNHLQTDPMAVTLGASYTPVPLVTMGVDYKKGEDSLDDMRLSLSFNYAFGVPWSAQISPESVRTLRSLAGSRYDFVTRNNDIVMQYRKQETIKLNLPAQLNGATNQSIPLVATVNTSNGLNHISWDSSSSLLRAGGSVVPGNDDLHYTVILPATAGSYTLTGTAYDNHNNASNAAQTQFTVTDQGGGGGTGSENIVFQKADTAWTDKPESVQVALTDSNNQPLTGKRVNFTLADCSDCTLDKSGAETALVNGKAIASVTLNKATPGNAQVKACEEGSDRCSSLTIPFYAPPQLSGKLTLSGQSTEATKLPDAWLYNGTFDLSKTVSGGNGQYTWSSSDPKVATVDSNGKVTIQNTLSAFTITVTSLGRSSESHSFTAQPGNKLLYVSDSHMNWNNAKAFCQTQGRDLSSPDSLKQVTDAWGNMKSYAYYNNTQKSWTNDISAAKDVATVFDMGAGVPVTGYQVKTDSEEVLAACM
ncbi:TPA: inverse autotransporter beta domain-containing protein [Enterobacter roggenkampii]|nr:inverse autotransporter beta domain-containing protein [Enterobacter roggenkampii]